MWCIFCPTEGSSDRARRHWRWNWRKKVMKVSTPTAEPIVVEDRALVEELISIPLEAAQKVEFRAGVSSRSRVLMDYGRVQIEKEKNIECDFYLESGACVDVFHILEGG